MICFHFSIFEPLETAYKIQLIHEVLLWFAFILVSLNHWKQHSSQPKISKYVVICFHFSIFEPLETAYIQQSIYTCLLWFAFILVSLNHWKQLFIFRFSISRVVICFHFSIFEPLETAVTSLSHDPFRLWFAFILVSLNHWKQLFNSIYFNKICCDLLSF